MKSREKMLALGVAVVVGLLLLNSVYGWVSGEFAQRNGAKADLEKKIADKEHTLAKGRQASKLLATLRHQSLPSDSEIARSLYYSWLVGLVDRVKLESANIDPLVSPGRSTVYEKFGYRIKAESDISLQQLVHFLYEFYNTNQLHQIRSLTVKPKADGKLVDVTIDVEALRLPGADRSNQLNLEKSGRLKLASAGEYEKVIGDRKVFVAYSPPRERRPEPPPRVASTTPKFDIAKFAKVTGITEDNDRPQIWVSVQTTGQLLKLTEGEDFTVGDIKCKVVRIGTRDAVVNVEGKTKQVKLEDNLRDAVEVPEGEL